MEKCSLVTDQNSTRANGSLLFTCPALNKNCQCKKSEITKLLFQTCWGSGIDSLNLCFVTQAEFVTAILGKCNALVYALGATHPLHF